MAEYQREWALAKEELMREMEHLGFPQDLGDAIAKQLGSPKAIRRMSAYLYHVQPDSAELVVDEMLAICSEIEAWREKKAAREANAAYNELLYYGPGGDEEERSCDAGFPDGK